MPQSTIMNFVLDPSTGALVTLEHWLNKINFGDSFHLSDVVALDSGVQQWLLITPDSKVWSHVSFSVICTSEISLSVTGGADRDGVTPLQSVNRNQNADSVATMQAYRGVQGGTTDGLVDVLRLRSGATEKLGKTTIATGGHAEQFAYILKQDTRYVITAETFGEAHVSLDLNWYEHTPKVLE